MAGRAPGDSIDAAGRTPAETIDAVGRQLAQYRRVAVAVSGGIDSLTLATLAGSRPDVEAEMYHAVSPAVPPEATARVRRVGAQHGWRLQVIDAAEFARDEYVSNPVDRCFFCKQSLYSTIARATDAQIVSGTNADDLGEYRPGLDAARAAGVRHPFAELGVDKRTIRDLARHLGLGGLAELPAAPCLSSRVETGIAIDPAVLASIHAAETAIRARIAASSVRCRVRASGVVIEIDAPTLQALSPATRADLVAAVAQVFGSERAGPPPRIEAYRNGSAFLLTRHDRARHPS